MSYSSYGYIPYLDNHTEALRVFNNTTPIRGSKPVRVPLGRRSDSNKFGISKTDNGDIHLSLYGHTGIVFHADNHTLTIGDPSGKRQWRWSSCDSYFVVAVLGRYVRDVRTDRGRLVVETRDGQKFVLDSKSNLILTYNKNTHTLTPVAQATQYTYRLNRQATNNVRARYGEFYRYMKGMIGVRKELKVDQYYNYRNQEYVTDEEMVIRVSEQEQAGVVPVKETEHTWTGTKRKETVPDPDFPLNCVCPNDKPPRLATRYEQFDLDNNETGYRHVDTTEPYDSWVASAQAFLSLITTPADDPDQHEKFRQAFVWLTRFASGRNYRISDITVSVGAVQKCIDEIIFKWHSEEVIERVPAKPNTVPGGKYLKWITRERD